MSDIKVVVAHSLDFPMIGLRESLKKNGFQVSSFASGFDALNEILNSGGNLLVVSDKLSDISGYQLSCLLKATPVINLLPVVVVSTSKGNFEETFWSRACLADSVLQRKAVESSEEDAVKLIKRLIDASLQYKLSPELFDDQPVVAGEFSSSDLTRSYGEMLSGLLSERLVRNFARRLSATINDRAEFTTQFFDVVSRLFRPDIIGLVVNFPGSPWSIYHLKKTMDKEAFDKIVGQADGLLDLKAPSQSTVFGDTSEKKGTKLKKAKILVVRAGDGSKLGTVVLGWSTDAVIDQDLKTALEHLRDQMEPVLQLLFLEQRYSLLQQQAQYWSTVDQITGLYNLEFFMGFLQQQLLFSARQKLPVCLLLVDIDGFLKLNEELGFESGNLILATLSERFAKCVRASDLMARYGGDQFAVIVPNTDIVGAKILGEKLRQEAMKTTIDSINGKSPTLTISVGCASFNMDDSNVETILRDTKMALNRAKEKGRNCVSD